ncbi:hypothetical protein CCP3SC15_730007 [Gammaproteobacteria bacterium]
MTQALPTQLPEWSYLSWDWKQAELYLLALFSKDAKLYAALQSGDVHRQIMAWARDMDPADVTDDMREVSKVIVYAAPYSGFDIPSTVSNAVKKATLKGIPLTKQEAETTLLRIINTFDRLYAWTGEALLDWYDSHGEVAYLLNARRKIIYPDYLKRDLDKLRQSQDGRTAINCYGQNSVGLLLKLFMSNIYKDPFLREHTRQHLPLFDAHTCLVRTKHLADVQRRLHSLATPILRCNDFEVRMAVDWKGSLKSWGDLRKLPTPDESDEKYTPPEYTWEAKPLAQAVPPQVQGVNPFSGPPPVSGESVANALVEATNFNPFAAH